MRDAATNFAVRLAQSCRDSEQRLEALMAQLVEGDRVRAERHARIMANFDAMDAALAPQGERA